MSIDPVTSSTMIFANVAVSMVGIFLLSVFESVCAKRKFSTEGPFAGFYLACLVVRIAYGTELVVFLRSLIGLFILLYPLLAWLCTKILRATIASSEPDGFTADPGEQAAREDPVEHVLIVLCWAMFSAYCATDFAADRFSRHNFLVFGPVLTLVYTAAFAGCLPAALAVLEGGSTLVKKSVQLIGRVRDRLVNLLT